MYMYVTDVFNIATHSSISQSLTEEMSMKDVVYGCLDRLVVRAHHLELVRETGRLPFEPQPELPSVCPEAELDMSLTAPSVAGAAFGTLMSRVGLRPTVARLLVVPYVFVQSVSWKKRKSLVGIKLLKK